LRSAVVQFVLLLVLCGSGCVVIPLGPFTDAPYPPAVLQALLHDHADRNAVRRALGKPRAVKAGGRYWFYTSVRTVAGILGGSSGAVIDDYEWVMLEFDAAGRVVFLEYNDDKDGCLSNGICYLAGFLGDQSVITAPAVQSAAAVSSQPGIDECVVYLYLEETPWYYSILPLQFFIDGHPLGRVDEHSFLFMTHPAGTIRISAYQFDIAVPCTGGNRVYVRAVKAQDITWENGADLAPVQETQGAADIHARRLALPD